MPRVSPAAVRVLIVVALAALWEALPRLDVIPELFLPPLTKTVTALVADRAEYMDALATTLLEVGAGMVFACGGGMVAGAVLGSVRPLGRLLLPMLSSVFAVPLVVVYPMLTVWLGIGAESKVAFASVYGFIPTALATAAGARSIEPHLLLTARSMGATRFQQVLRVVLPASIPTVLAGLRLGGVLVIVGVVVSEMLVSTAGIGYLVTRYRTILDSAHVFAAVLAILALTLGFDGLMRLVEWRLAAWRGAGRTSTARSQPPAAPA